MSYSEKIPDGTAEGWLQEGSWTSYKRQIQKPPLNGEDLLTAKDLARMPEIGLLGPEKMGSKKHFRWKPNRKNNIRPLKGQREFPFGELD